MATSPMAHSYSFHLIGAVATLAAVAAIAAAAGGVSQTAIDAIRDDSKLDMDLMDLANMFNWREQKRKQPRQSSYLNSREKEKEEEEEEEKEEDSAEILERQMRSVYPVEGGPSKQEQNGGWVDMNGWMPKVRTSTGLQMDCMVAML